MKLTDEQKKIVENELDKNWVNKKCPLCGDETWSFTDRVLELREFQQGSLSFGGDSVLFPVIAVTCQKCTYTIFLSAVKLGLFKNEEKTKK